MNHSNVIITPQYPVLVSEYDNTAHVLVRFQAPEHLEKQTKRSNLNLAIVLDRSGSMSGHPIKEAKRCASYMIDQLSKEDRAAIVIYDDEVELLAPCTHVVNKDDFFMKLQLVHSRGMTNLHGGWLRGAEEIAQYASSDSITRVILLSDGLANKGLTDPDAIKKQCSELAQAGVTTSTYGLGNDFNEELMVGMARAGQGVPYYGETADDLLDPFQEEFSLLSSLFAKETKMKLKLAKNIRAEILNQY
ncbi:MAG: vWA domain-containing protein, partial [Candidatus Hinthialibacter sp.]